MKLILPIFLLEYLVSVTYAQTASFTVGPVIGLDQFLSNPKPVTGPNIAKNTAVDYKTGLLYGIEGTYLLKHVLLNARLLTTRRVYDVTSLYQSNPKYPVRVTVKARYYSSPITISYFLKTIHGIQLYGGMGVVPEWINGNFDRTSYDILGSGNFINLEPERPEKVFMLGGSLQVIGRYKVNEQFVLQAQPALHYFKDAQTPFATTNNSAFSVTVSISYVVE